MTEKRKRTQSAALLMLLCLLTACSPTAVDAPPDVPSEVPAVSDVSAPVEMPEKPVEPPVPEKEPWAPVAASDPVDDSYFDDAAFVGDSRTDGFRLYSGLERGMYFYVTGETVASATELQNWKTESGEKISLADAVAAADCGKIYLMMGVNELGWNGTDIFRGHAETLLQRLMADHPEAELVIQSLLPVTAEQDAKGTYVNNRRILAYNQVWLELAEQYDCNYVNVAEAVTDEDGCLPKELSYDGVHLNKAGCRLWLDYLRTHSVGGAAIVEDTEPSPSESTADP